LPLTIGGQLHVHDLSSDHDVLMIVLFRVGQELRDLNQASGCCRGRRAQDSWQARADEEEQEEDSH
jgi:hypothetical protein